MQGNAVDVLRALHAAQSAAVAAGATRIVVNLETDGRVAGNDEFARALADALGPLYRISVLDTAGNVESSYGTVTSECISRAQLPLAGSSGTLLVEFDRGAVDRDDDPARLSLMTGEAPAGAFTHVDRALNELITMAEGRIGRPLTEMSRAEKQQVVRFLDGRGAFALRKSVETVADALGVSRFTVYNYLDSSRQADPSNADL
jgi:hypothetical protein